MFSFQSSGRPNLESTGELTVKLKRLMLFRIVFCVFLLGSTIFIQHGKNLTRLNPPLLLLYGIVIGVFLLSILYAVILPRLKDTLIFAYFQIGIDITVATLIIYGTGNFASIFSFLYLLIIIYSSTLVDRKGALIMALLANMQYAATLTLEYFGMIHPFVQRFQGSKDFELTHVIYKIGVMLASSFAVSILSSFLAEQTRVTQKELKLMEEHVRRVEKMAYLGELSAGLAHEIKNPLASLLGAIQMMKDDMSFNPHHDRLMKIVIRETDRLNTLLGDFLFFSKPPAGNLQKIDVGQSLDDILDLFQNAKSVKKHLSITLNYSKNLYIKMDPIHFQQIIWNLFLNAADAIHEDGQIHVNASVVKPGVILIQIRDTGQGISEENRQQIFNPFFTTKPSGTGLGLSIVHRLLEFYYARLDVDSRPGHGTTMSIRLKEADASHLSLFR
ncbi:MAG: nitrogen regulation protein NR(II) [Desulfatirhabdiaceae bacterium]